MSGPTFGLEVGETRREVRSREQARRQEQSRRPEPARGRHSTPSTGLGPGIRWPGRTAKTTRANQNALGARHLGIGLTFSGGVIAVFLLWRFAVQWTGYPFLLLPLVAWVLLAATVAVGLATTQQSARMPHWLFPTALAAGGVAAVADLIGSWGLAGDGIYPTAAPAAGALLTGFVTSRQSREILAATGLLGVAMLTAIAVAHRDDPLTLGTDVLTLLLALGPAVLSVFIVRAFRRMVQLELDLVLVQGTVSQPRYTVGMLASEQLAELDLEAERLLEDVATGQAPLPLPQEDANIAATLATQLRVHLIEGRKETWLHHAINESEFLAPSVDLHDPNGLAGLLSPAQRDALLLTLWLLIGDATRNTTVSLTLGPIPPAARGDQGKLVFPIRLSTTGVPRRRVDPETWQAIRVVGPYVDSGRGGSVSADITCSVDNPADA